MDLIDARAMAEVLVREHGLDGWTVALDRARTRAGLCDPARRRISLSTVLTLRHERAEVRRTVLHEIAHALVGPGHGHDAVWRATAVRIGGTGEARLRGAPLVEGDWVGTCPAGHEARRHRRPGRPLSCGRCAPLSGLDALLTWRWRGREAPMTPGYERELALLRRRPDLVRR